MRFLGPPIAAWIILMRVQNTIPRALADDPTTISIGTDALETTTAALLATYGFLNAFGCKVRIQKTLAFASDTTMRARLAKIRFQGQHGIDLVVAHEHREGATSISPEEEQVQSSQSAPRSHQTAQGFGAPARAFLQHTQTHRHQISPHGPIRCPHCA